MVSSPHRNEIAFRLKGYIPELQFLFQKHGLTTGSQADLEPGTRALSLQPSLREELSATLRSIVYRDQEQVTEEDLIQLLIAALAGAAVEVDAADLVEPRRRAGELLTTALRSFSRGAPDAPYRSRLSQEPARRGAQRTDSQPSPAQPQVITVSETGGSSREVAGQEARHQPVSSPEQTVTPGLGVSEGFAFGGETPSPDSPTPSPRKLLEPASLDGSNMASNQDAVAREVARMLAQDLALKGAPSAAEPISRPARVIEEVRLAGESEIPPSPLPSQPPAFPVSSPGVPLSLSPRDSEPEVPGRFVGLASGSAGDRFAEARRSTGGGAPVDVATRLPTRRPSEQGPPNDDEGTFPEYRALPLIRPEHRTLWIVGVCCLVLGLVAGLLVRGRHVTQNVPALNREVVPTSTSQIKPSPYVLPAPMVTSGKVAESLNRAPRTNQTSRPPVSEQSPTAEVGTSDGTEGLSSLPVRVEGRNTTQAPTARYTPQSADDLASDVRAATSGASPKFGSVPSQVVTGSSDSPAGSVYLSAAGVMASKLVAAPAPVYPAQASAAGVQGRVVVQALVGRDGHVLDAHVTSGDHLLREAALEAVTRWRYRPFLADGRPTEVETVAILDFKLSQ